MFERLSSIFGGTPEPAPQPDVASPYDDTLDALMWLVEWAQRDGYGVSVEPENGGTRISIDLPGRQVSWLVSPESGAAFDDVISTGRGYDGGI